jgi:TPR repeat protein
MDEKNEGSKAEEERLAALAMDILSAKPQEHELVLEFDRLYKEFIDFANKENAMQDEAKQIHKMQDVRKRLELVENFPFIYGKQIGAVGGGFSAGKSSFLNTFIKDKSIVLAVGVTPITVIPCYITCEDGSSITGYTEKGGRFSIEPETFKTISHEFLKSMNFDLKEHLPYISISSPLDKQLFSNICFIDTPGYDPAGISSDETDVDTAAEYILKADFLIWLINIESGCLMQTDIDFLNELAQKKDFAFYVVINKADLKPEDDSAAVLKRIQEDVEDRLDLKCSGISLYNSRKGKEYSFKGQSVTDFIKSHNTFVENKTYKEIETEIDEVLNAYMDALNNQKIEYEKDAKPIAEIEEHLKTAKELKGKFERGIILKLNERAAAQGHLGAQYKLGEMYYRGEGVKQDYQKAREWYEKAAAQGHLGAQCKLGEMYYRGEGVKQDYGKAVYLFEKAVERNYARAQFYLGAMYYKGKGASQDCAKAIYLFEKAAMQGHAAAQYNLGCMYYAGKGVYWDYEKAFYWLEKAAQQGYATAQNKLGYIYGIKQDYQKAFFWYEKAAKQGNAAAQFYLGAMYEDGEGGVNQDYQKASFWYEKAARQGDVNAQYNLGALYNNGEGVKQDYKRAFYWYEKAAEQGDADAQYNLGALYNTGKGVKQDYQKAREWYEKAAAQGNIYAQNRLVDMYYNGEGKAQIKMIVFACDAGMGSSAMGETMLKKKLKAAGLEGIKVVHSSIDQLPGNPDIIFVHAQLKGRVESRCPKSRIIAVTDLIAAPQYDQLIAELAKKN